MTYYTGLDVSLRSVSICIVHDEGEGEVRHEAKVPSEVDKIVAWGPAVQLTDGQAQEEMSHWLNILANQERKRPGRPDGRA